MIHNADAEEEKQSFLIAKQSSNGRQDCSSSVGNELQKERGDQSPSEKTTFREWIPNKAAHSSAAAEPAAMKKARVSVRARSEAPVVSQRAS